MPDTMRKFLKQLHIFAVQLQFSYLSKMSKPVPVLHICNVLRASAEGGKKLGQEMFKGVRRFPCAPYHLSRGCKFKYGGGVCITWIPRKCASSSARKIFKFSPFRGKGRCITQDSKLLLFLVEWSFSIFTCGGS